VIDFISAIELTDRSVNASCLLDSQDLGTGLSGVVVGGNERPTKALAEAAVLAEGQAYAFIPATNGAGGARQKKQHQTMWAFRGLKPWRDPA
jgi:hypothetical protein